MKTIHRTKTKNKAKRAHLHSTTETSNMAMTMERTPHAVHSHCAFSTPALRCVVSCTPHTTHGPFFFFFFLPCHPRHQKKKVQQSGVGGSGASHRGGVTLRPPVPILREEKEGDPYARYTPLHYINRLPPRLSRHIFRTVPSLDMSCIETHPRQRRKGKAACAHLSVSFVGMAGRGAGLVRRGHIGSGR